MSDLFGKSFDLPSFVHPDSFRRNIVSGPIPSPTLITEPVPGDKLNLGDLVLFFGKLYEVSELEYADTKDTEGNVIGSEVVSCRIRAYNVPEALSLKVVPSDVAQKVRGVTFGLLSQEIPLKWLRDDSQTYFGKFDSQLSEYCWTQALDDGNYIGSCDDMGFVATRIDITQVDGRNYPYRSDSVVQQWADGPNDYPAGYIVTGYDSGRVDVEFFDTVAELDAEWNRLQELETELRGPDEEDCVINADGTVYFAGEILADVGDYDSEEDVYRVIRLAMDNHNFYPNVWRISDHGNAQIIDIGGTE